METVPTLSHVGWNTNQYTHTHIHILSMGHHALSETHNHAVPHTHTHTQRHTLSTYHRQWIPNWWRTDHLMWEVYVIRPPSPRIKRERSSRAHLQSNDTNAWHSPGLLLPPKVWLLSLGRLNISGRPPGTGKWLYIYKYMCICMYVCYIWVHVVCSIFASVVNVWICVLCVVCFHPLH